MIEYIELFRNGGIHMATELKIIQIPITQLEKNMVIAADIIDPQGRMLIAKEYEVKSPNRVRDLLDKYTIKSIPVYVHQTNSSDKEVFPIPDAKDMSLINALDEEIITFKESFSSIKERITTDFQHILEGKELSIHTLKERTNNHLKIFNLRTNIFQLIEFMRTMDQSLYTHCYQVALTSYTIGKWMGLPKNDLEELFLAALLIDLGKLQLPKGLLSKKDSLTATEKIEIQKHAIYSYHLIKPYPNISHKIKQAVLTHHEQIDGKGYPLSLKALDIPLYSRIIAIADTYNTLITKSYGTFTVFDVLKIMETSYKSALDLNILYTFLKHIGHCFIGQKIRLSNEEIGEIVFIHNKQFNKPLVKLFSTNKVIDLNTYQSSLKITRLVL